MDSQQSQQQSKTGIDYHVELVENLIKNGSEEEKKN
jgi:hypothetical protein